MTTAAVLFLVGLGVGMVAGDLWRFCVELVDLYREQRRP